MPTYQGRALRSEAANRNRGPRGPLRRLARVARVVVVLGVITALAHVPWGALRHAAIRVAAIRVAGLHYLDAPAVVTRSGLTIGMGWLDADLRGARQRLLSDSRIRSAKVSRTFPNGIDISVEERVPVLLVRHGSPWELDADGVRAGLGGGDRRPTARTGGPDLRVRRLRRGLDRGRADGRHPGPGAGLAPRGEHAVVAPRRPRLARAARNCGTGDRSEV